MQDLSIVMCSSYDVQALLFDICVKQNKKLNTHFTREFKQI